MAFVQLPKLMPQLGKIISG